MRTQLLLVLLVLAIFDVADAAKKYMVRKNGRLDRLHRRTMTEWKHAHHHRSRRHRHKRRRHERDGMRIEHVLAQMDSFVRPRFGRSVRYAPHV